MMRAIHKVLCISFFSFVAPSCVMAADFTVLLETFLSQGGQEGHVSLFSPGDLKRNLQELDFYSTNRIALPLGPVSLGFDIGGAGCGSPFLPLPSAQRMYFDWKRDEPSDAGAQARTAAFKLIQDQLAGLIGGGDASVNFFATEEAETLKQHPLEKILNFKVTPSTVWVIKFALLLKHIAGHWHDAQANRFVQGFSYFADLGILTIRLLRAWRRDSRVAGGISHVIEERAPAVGQILREISAKYIPVSLNPDHSPLACHRFIDSFWKLIMTGDGIIFGPDGSVQKGLGFGVTGLECRSAEDAEFLAAFLNQKQINWDMIETQTMVNKPFIIRVATLIQMYSKQLASMPEEQRATRMEEAGRLQEIAQDLALRSAQKNFGRYDLDPENNTTVHPQLQSRLFSALVGADKPIDAYTKLPVVLAAGNFVYYCTNEAGALDAGKIVAVIFFQALWRYLDVIRGSKEMDSEVTAKVREKERSLKSAQTYLQTPEASFLQLPLGLLLERPTVDFYALAGKFVKDKDAGVKRDELVKNLIKDTAVNYKKAAARVGNIYKAALEGIATKSSSLDLIKGTYAPLLVPAAAA